MPPPSTPMLTSMKRGSGSVTAMPGWMRSIGASSPKARATVSAQAPAQFSSQRRAHAQALAVAEHEVLPSWPSSVTSQCSITRAPAARAARAKAGLTRRGLAWPSPGHQDAATACAPSQG
jgi:hypothetical protein